MVAVILISDLLLGSKVRETLKAMEMEAVFVSAPESLEAALPGADLLIADVNDARLAPLEAIRRAKERGLPILAYGSHVDAEALAAARRAGADQAVPRSVFSARLGELIGSLIASRSNRSAPHAGEPAPAVEGPAAPDERQTSEEDVAGNKPHGPAKGQSAADDGRSAPGDERSAAGNERQAPRDKR